MRRQRLKRAFPGPAASERRGGSIGWKRLRRGSISSRHRPPAPRHDLRHMRRAAESAGDTETRLLSIAAIGPPPRSRANPPPGRGPDRASDRAGAPGAPPPTATRPASSAGSPPPRGRSVPRWVRANSPPRERSFSPFRIVGKVCCRRRPSPPLRPDAPDWCTRPAVRKSWHRSQSVMSGHRRPAPASGATPRRRSLGNPRTVAGRRCSSNLSEAIGRSIARRPTGPIAASDPAAERPPATAFPGGSLPAAPRAIMDGPDPVGTDRRANGMSHVAGRDHIRDERDHRGPDRGCSRDGFGRPRMRGLAAVRRHGGRRSASGPMGRSSNGVTTAEAAMSGRSRIASGC